MNHRSTSADDAGAHAIALEVLAGWAATFATMDPAAMAALYSDRALFFGSRPTVFERRAGVRQYFATLPPRSRHGVRFDDIVASFVSADVVQLAAIAHFSVDDRPPLPMRLTQTLVRAGDRWLVASHHASRVPAAA